MHALERFFKGLADITRLRVVNLLTEEELCGCDIQFILGTRQSNVSRHLTYLKNCGLLESRRCGYRIYYRLVVLVENRILIEHLSQVLRREEPFGSDLKRLRTAIRNGSCTISERSIKNDPGTLGRRSVSFK